MNNAKPTPGPWKVYDRGIGFEVHDADHTPINDGFRETFSEANARLIASAPELLAALKLCRLSLYDDMRNSEEADTAYRMAQAAISKAEGPPTQSTGADQK